MEAHKEKGRKSWRASLSVGLWGVVCCPSLGKKTK